MAIQYSLTHRTNAMTQLKQRQAALAELAREKAADARSLREQIEEIVSPKAPKSAPVEKSVEVAGAVEIEPGALEDDDEETLLLLLG